MKTVRKIFKPEYFIFLLIYLVIAGLNKMGVINAYLFQVITIAGINVIMTISLNLVIGITGQFSMGHAGFMSIGAYISAIVTRLAFQVLERTALTDNLILLAAVIAGGIIAAVFGFIIAMPTLKVKGDYLAIVTLGFGEIIRAVWRVVDYTGGALGFSGIPKLTNFTWVFVILLIAIYASRNFIKSSFGRSCLAVRENDIAAEAMGVNCRNYKVLAFVFAAFMAGVAGGLYAHLIQFIQPDNFSAAKSTDYIVYLYAGGVGTISGSIFGAVVLTILPELLRFLNDWRLVIYALLLLYIIIWKPYGLFGGREFKFLNLETIEATDSKLGKWIRRRLKRKKEEAKS
ncbi:branched-chain amino acid ABC transporter permease [Qiania dongpingensis]|uniref:Branched-chain amino acid ABC transporter permease n=1 Tax=Qiania dongpingensis TaxID=2763669 RepID=A0A7G9G1A4_9FIRM|nr:branched-chain amino acid ABC transporter permease [Qiania dongpingensis]QNM04586.1 branched-chain amino acid ABC transporter permease [Qiania dongpingensis]